MPTPSLRSLSGVFILSGVVAALPASYPTIPMRGISGNTPMPLIGLGTWQYNASTAFGAVTTAFSAGYRHVDTALGYANQEGVGRALKALALPRDEYFVTGKVQGGLNATATTAALELSLQQLQLKHVDLMLLHWPAVGAEGRQAQWKALEAWAKKGGAKAIGVSHYCRRHLDDVLAVATLPIAYNQVQFHVGMGRENTSELHDRAYMKSKGVVYAAYSSLCGPCPNGGHAELISGPLVSAIGAQHGKSGAQVSLRWVVQQGIPVIPKASSLQYLREDFDLFDWALTEEEMWRLGNATSPPQTGTPPQAPDDDQDCLVKLVDAVVSAGSGSSSPRLCNCSDASASQAWTLKAGDAATTTSVVSRASGACLGVGNLSSAALLETCGAPSTPVPTPGRQQWAFSMKTKTTPRLVELTQLTWGLHPDQEQLCLTAQSSSESGLLDVEPCNGARAAQAFSFGVVNGHIIQGVPPFTDAALCVSSEQC